MKTRFVARADVESTREQLGTTGQEIWRTWFLKPAPNTRLPQAFLVEYAPARVLRTHYHDVDEFQIVVAGSGTFGHHEVGVGVVHFARAFTPYGPITAGAGGLSFLTLRAQRDSAGPQKFPEMRDALEKIEGRRPFQIAQQVVFDAEKDEVSMHALARFAHAGMHAWTIELPPGIAARLPGADRSAGQFVAVLQGSLVLDGRGVDAPVVTWVESDEERMRVAAGPMGARLVVLNFPLASAATVDRLAPTSGRWDCTLCGFSYDESIGQAERGIAPGTPWSDLPQDWRCDDCDAPKSDFVRAG
jgi:rubredoxin